MNEFYGQIGGDGWFGTFGTGGGGWGGGQVYYPPYPTMPPYGIGAGMHPQTQQLLFLGLIVVGAYLILK